MSEDRHARLDPARCRGPSEHRLTRRTCSGTRGRVAGVRPRLDPGGLRGRDGGGDHRRRGSGRPADVFSGEPGRHAQLRELARVHRPGARTRTGTSPSVPDAFTAADRASTSTTGTTSTTTPSSSARSSRARGGRRHGLGHHRDHELPVLHRADAERLGDRARPREAAELRRERGQLPRTPPTTRATSTRWRGSRASPASAVNTKHVNGPITKMDDLRTRQGRTGSVAMFNGRTCPTG